ncbi:hypothetical protein Tco_0347224 [Tanacetum coccineum]
MSTNRRQRKRQLKIPIRYADHVMGNMSQKQKDVNKAVKSKDTMVEKGDLNEVIGENEISKDGGVFGFEYCPRTEIDSNGNEVVVFDEVLVAEGRELNDMRNRELVDDFISQKRDPTDSESLKWNIDIVAYYKQRKEELDNKGKANIVQSKKLLKRMMYFRMIGGDEIRGMDKGVLGA